jgi:F0F1-type ATP synthase membrane subunit b/b'
MGVSSFFSNLFGKAKDTTLDLAVEAEVKLEEAREAATPYIEKAKEAAEPVLESAAAYAQEARDLVSEFVEKTSDTIGDVIETVKEKLSDGTDDNKTIAVESVVDISEKPQLPED